MHAYTHSDINKRNSLFIRSVVAVHLLSCVQVFVSSWTEVHQASQYFIISQSWLKLDSIESMMPSNNLILCCPFLLLPSIFPSIRVFFNEFDVGIMQPKYWSFSFSISPSNEYSGLISFRIDWFELLVVQGTLMSLLQHRNSKASVIWGMIQLLHPYTTTGKIIALTIQTK